MSNATTTDEFSLLRESTRKALRVHSAGPADECAPQPWQASWAALDELGLWATIEPPEGSLAAAAVVVEEVGRALYPGPAGEALAASYVVHNLDGGAALSASVAVLPSAALMTGSIDSDSGPGKAGVCLDPTIRHLDETMLIVMAADEPVFVIAAGEADSEPVPSMDLSRDIVRLHLDAPPATAMTPVDPRVAQFGHAARRLLYCADTLGCVDSVLAKTAQYAGQRTTFGSPIGKYQAVAHRLVDHAITAQQMRLLLDTAVAAFDSHADDVALHVATAEAFFARRGIDLISDCIQLSGAIGFTWEFGHHFYLRRVVANAALAGRPGRPHQRLAAVSPW